MMRAFLGAAIVNLAWAGWRLWLRPKLRRNRSGGTAMPTADDLCQKIMAIGGTPIGTAIPAELGSVTRLRARGDRLLAYTESGAIVILYAPTGEGDLQ
jgi:hypothetical protein